MTKFVVITGGVISTLGKGVITASAALLLKRKNYKVTVVKIDPYINVDAGTMRPTEHGEVYVTFDGGETDQDLGNYERFLNQKISKNNNITTGQIYQNVIKKERNLEYDGKCVQVMHHIPEEIERRVKKAGQDSKADIVFIEVGGTVGDYENIPYLEALRRMKLRGENVSFIHVSYLPIPRTAGEMKSKPTQHSVKALSAQGIQADILVCRASQILDNVRREKIGLFCNLKDDEVFSCPDLKSIYEVPFLLKKQGFDKKLSEILGLNNKEPELSDWKKYIATKQDQEITIGIVGKYFKTGDYQLEDSYHSVVEAIKHACNHEKVKPVIKWLNSDENNNLEIDAMIVPGGFGKTGVEGKIESIKYARENKIPFLGLCYGLQLSVIEHARNLLGLKDANTTEIVPDTNNPVISTMPEQIKLLQKKNYGGSMRLGEQKAVLKKASLTANLYKSLEVFERHRHRYEVNPSYKERLEAKGLVVSGVHPDLGLVEFIERKDHPYFVATQAHPEFTSTPLKPNPLFLGLIRAAKKKILD